MDSEKATESRFEDEGCSDRYLIPAPHEQNSIALTQS
jgi:hypothetical protein